MPLVFYILSKRLGVGVVPGGELSQVSTPSPGFQIFKGKLITEVAVNCSVREEEGVLTCDNSPPGTTPTPSLLESM
jgi:hypothetical protein